MLKIYKKILLALNESENSVRATKEVIELQKQWSSEVVIFHSIKHIKDREFSTITLIASNGAKHCLCEEFLMKYKKAGRMLLKTYKDQFKDAQLDVETRLIIDEFPKEYIRRIVSEENFDLVVLGLKGIHSKFKQKIMGSVAQKVVNHAPCDLLVVQ